MTEKSTLTRRALAQRAVAGAAGALLAAAVSASPAETATPPTATEADLLTQAVPANVGYALTETQAKAVAAQLKEYPGGFAQARAFPLPDSVGPAFAADPPARKGRAR